MTFDGGDGCGVGAADGSCVGDAAGAATSTTRRPPNDAFDDVSIPLGTTSRAHTTTGPSPPALGNRTSTSTAASTSATPKYASYAFCEQ